MAAGPRGSARTTPRVRVQLQAAKRAPMPLPYPPRAEPLGGGQNGAAVPPCWTFSAQNCGGSGVSSGEFAFGAVDDDLDCRRGPDGVRFTWEGLDEMDPASGAGSAELEPDGSLTGEIRFHLGDESTFDARRRRAFPQPVSLTVSFASTVRCVAGGSMGSVAGFWRSLR